MDMKVVNSIKYGWNTIALMKIVRQRHLCQNLYQLQNLKILLKFQGHKNPHGQNFWNLIFYLKRQGYTDITRTKIPLGSIHLLA